eukprot:12561393-Prorocentrum_lima.AAC.1
MGDPEGLEQHYKQGHIPKRKDCPVRQQTSGPECDTISGLIEQKGLGHLMWTLRDLFETTGEEG